MNRTHTTRWTWTARSTVLGVGLTIALVAAGCAKKQPPIARIPPPPAVPSGQTAPTPPPSPPPPERVSEPTLSTPEPVVTESSLEAKSLDELNRLSPLEPVFFGYDSADLTPEGQATLSKNAAVLKKYTGWLITIEGHCDERGTAEYNLALGERRALAANAYLVSLGIPTSRLRTVSYGKEFPFDPARTEDAYAKNRRAHFVITSK